MQLLPETLLKQEENKKYPGFSLLLVLQCLLVPPSGQTSPKEVVIMIWKMQSTEVTPLLTIPGEVIQSKEWRTHLRAKRAKDRLHCIYSCLSTILYSHTTLSSFHLTCGSFSLEDVVLILPSKNRDTKSPQSLFLSQ